MYSHVLKKLKKTPPICKRNKNLGPVVQSIVSLTSLLVVKIITVLVSTISNSQLFLLKNCDYFLQLKKLFTFFQQKCLTMPYLIIKVLTIR